MYARERVLTALEQREPDRIPIDLGGMDSTGITAIAYNRLKDFLGIKGGETRVFDPYQQVVLVERAVLEAVGADVLPLPLEPHCWQPSILSDGSACLVPGRWNPRLQADGSRVVLDEEGVVRARMPAGGFYFESVNPPLADAVSAADIERKLPLLEGFDWPFFCDDTFEDLASRGECLYGKTDYAVMGNFAVHIFAAGQQLRGFEQFMMDLAADREIACCIMEHLTDIYIRRFDAWNRAVGGYVQIVNVNDDLGSQTGLMLSPGMYREMVRPYQERLYRHIKESSDLYLFLHSDGSVYDIIPDLIEMGVDILNPVQFTCRGMELPRLKREFGADITFWGGGCDTQRILPAASPREVKRHVRECISVLAPGGGFVFNQLHNIQPDVPPENIMAMYEAVMEWRY